MKCYQNFSMFDNQDTPMGTMEIESLPDEMKPILQKSRRTQNFDILLHKFCNNEQLTDIQLQQLNQQQRLVIEQIKLKIQSKTRRPDEYQKQFYKKAFKHAQNLYFKKNKKNRSRKMSQFYHHHFDEVAKRLGIPLVNFYHPDKKTKPGLHTGQKSFNSSFVKIILKSKTFRKVCQDYHSNFIQECTKQRNRKISTFSSSISSLIQKNKQDIKKTIQFLQSSKCKIPWTNQDIHEAHKRAEEQLDGNFDQQITSSGQQLIIETYEHASDSDQSQQEIIGLRSEIAPDLKKRKGIQEISPIQSPSTQLIANMELKLSFDLMEL